VIEESNDRKVEKSNICLRNSTPLLLGNPRPLLTDAVLGAISAGEGGRLARWRHVVIVAVLGGVSNDRQVAHGTVFAETGVR